jgi:maltodextrin utilization protein YvdJ
VVLLVVVAVVVHMEVLVEELEELEDQVVVDPVEVIVLDQDQQNLELQAQQTLVVVAVVKEVTQVLEQQVDLVL